MFTTDTNAVRTLKTIAMVAALTITMWSLGLPYLQYAGAAAIQNVSDTLSSSAPATGADHEIVFDATTGVANGETITITFPAGFTIGSVDDTDIDVSGEIFGAYSVAADCTGADEIGAAFSGQVLTLEFCAGDAADVQATEEVTILIGENATGGDQQITNPGVGSYQIDITSGSSDSGSTQVAIIEEVTVTAAVNTVFSFTVTGVGSGVDVNGDTTTGTTTATSVAFGSLSDGQATTTAQDLAVETNSSNGYNVTLQIDGPLQSSVGDDINGFVEGSDTNSPAAWSAPSGELGSDNTYGHWGVTSEDFVTHGRGEEFSAGTYIAASTSPRIVMGHNGPSDATTDGSGATRVGFKIEITSLQEAATDYSTTLTYVATPVF